MDLFRHKKRPSDDEEENNSILEDESEVGEEKVEEEPEIDPEGAASALTPSKHERLVIEGLADSDDDDAEIFDDNDEDEELEQMTSAASSVRGAEVASLSPQSFKEVIDNIGSHFKVPSVIESEASKTDMATDHPDESAETESDNDKSASDSAEDYTDDEDEGADGYKPGGYHPVSVGEIYNQRYVRSYCETLVSKRRVAHRLAL